MQTANEEQAEYWGRSASGAKWLTFEDKLDHLLAPVLDLVLERAELKSGMRVLDIGCGTGASTLAAARLVGPQGHVLGGDISEPFLERARHRAAAAGINTVDFKCLDAQVAPFEDAAHDAAISRFGVMFFEDSVEAFANIAKALAPGGRMTFAAWGPLSGNPWFRVPHVAATSHLGHPPKHDRYAPGPLAFHDIDHVINMMAEADLQDITANPVDLRLPGLDSIESTADLCTRVGPAARVIAHFDGTEADTRKILNTVVQEFSRFQTVEGFGIPAVINVFQASRPY